jgi:hypothetical protein
VYWRRNGLQLVGKGDSDGGLGDLDFGHDVLYGSYTHLDHLQLEHFSVDSITGKLQLMPSTVTLHSVRASLLHGKLASSGTINYQDERASPCDMDFKLRVHDLQIAGLLPPPTGGEEPLVEGLFSLSTALRAEGRNPLDLALGTFGDIDLSGRNGVYRGLAGRGGKASKASKAVVASDVPAYSVVAGNPAKVIKYRFDPETIKALLDIEWWHWSAEKITQHLEAIVGCDFIALRNAGDS